VEREEGDRRCSDAVEMEDGGGRGGGRECELGSGMERSRDGTQRKATKSAALTIGAGTVAMATRRNYATRRGGREMRSLFILKF
jgi:hypothetical protein